MAALSGPYVSRNNVVYRILIIEINFDCLPQGDVWLRIKYSRIYYRMFSYQSTLTLMKKDNVLIDCILDLCVSIFSSYFEEF